jgi:type II secretory pathway predicted ATPase ExeA
MAEISKLEILDYFGFRRDPFRACDFETADRARIRRIVAMAVADNAMVCVVGVRGMGKTRAVVDACRRHGLTPVVIDFPDQARLLIGDIERTLVRELSDETPRRSKDARKPQLRRILGEAARQRKVVVVIEEAHRVHGMTLRALKTLRTLDWMGQQELFAAILIGQSDPLARAGVSEVRLRADSVRMQGLARVEAADYIGAVLGTEICPAETVREITRTGETGNFLELQRRLLELMGRAMAEGRRQVLPEDLEEGVAELAGPARRGGGGQGNAALRRALLNRQGEGRRDNPLLREVMAAAGISQAEIAEAVAVRLGSPVSRSLVNRALNHSYDPPSFAGFRETVEAILQESGKLKKWLAEHGLQLGDIWQPAAGTVETPLAAAV